LPEWKEKSLEQFREDVSCILIDNTDGWVCDGNYSRVRDLILPMTDTVVWLRLPFRIVFWNLLKRTVTRAWNKDILWGTNRESWRGMFFSRDSLLLYVIKNWKRYMRKISKDLDEIPHHASVIELHSLKEVDLYLDTLESTTDR
jgi:adenylate kinase family enzyme